MIAEKAKRQRSISSHKNVEIEKYKKEEQKAVSNDSLCDNPP